MRIRDLAVALVVAASLTAGALGAVPRPAGENTIWVRNEAEFAAAVSRLRGSEGRIVLLPRVYRGTLVVPPRWGGTLRIVGVRGARIERLVLDHTERVSIGGLTIAPVTQDAGIDVLGSRYVELHDLVVTARGTPYSASVRVPDSSRVAIRHSEFMHCGERSPAFSNCLLLLDWAKHVLVEDNWFHDCYGCDFIHGRFGSNLTIRGNRFERALPCRIGRVRCGHQDLIELFAGRRLRVEANRFGVYRVGGAQLYLTGAMSDVTIANNVFLGTDPRVPGYRARVGLIVGSAGSGPLPRYVRVVNNTILTGARRSDGYAGSLRMSSRYGSVAKGKRPIVANNVLGLLQTHGRVCATARMSVSNVVLRGSGCSRSDQVGPADLDRRGRPTATSTLLIDRANRHHAPRFDFTGRRRGVAPDVGAFEYHD